MNCWVISPNVLNDKSEPVEDFIKLIEKKHIALIGWHENKSLGYNFKNTIELNDLIIIAQGANRQKRNFFAGLVNSEAYKYKYEGNENNYTLQAINLKNFIDIRDKNISWNINCAQKKKDRIPSLYELKSDNPNDKKVIDEVLYYINSEGKMTEYIELLKSNKNLILTGAPGTGKTYLAKNIASQLISNKDYDESVENDINFKEQCAFVQFHPSYDYTDFVEGLRPKNDNGNIVFERKDGVFKAFCKKALKNLKDSEKDISTLNYEEIIKKYLEDFYNDVSMEITNSSEGYKIYGIGGGIAAPIIEINYNKSEVELDFTVKTKNANEYKFNNKLDLIADYYKKFITKKPEEWKYKDFVDTLNVKGYHTYIYGFLKAFYDNYNDKIEQEKNNITIEKVEEKKFIFIIDEINRGEISKIFGELFFSVDSGYRGEKGKVLTQYANLIEDGDEFKDGFYIPENVYIIGTMNDIDRSVESMDFAMRRRFAWKEIKAKDTQNMLDEYKWKNQINADIIQNAKEKMNRLNDAISNTPELSDAYNIGASYFLKLENYYKDNNMDEAFKKLWENHLEGLLFEYTRGMPNQKEIIDNLENAYNLKDNNQPNDNPNQD